MVPILKDIKKKAEIFHYLFFLVKAVKDVEAILEK